MTTGRVGYPANQYSVGQMLLDPSGSFRSNSLNATPPSGCTTSDTYLPQLRDGPIARLERPILVPGEKNEQTGQVDQVVFAEGLVQFKGKWFLYFGMLPTPILSFPFLSLFFSFPFLLFFFPGSPIQVDLVGTEE